MQIFKEILPYLLNVTIATAQQVFILLGPLLFLAFIMHLIAGQNQKLGIHVFGIKVYLYGFAWLGTAIHELGHALFALIFGHRIVSISLFSPNMKNGNLGYVDHSYNPESTYQNIGNFFIGIGPILLGSACIYGISVLLYGTGIIDFNYKFGYESISSLDSFKLGLYAIYENSQSYFLSVFSGDTSAVWKTIILIYVLFSIGSSVRLSASDISHSAHGLIFFVILLFIFNLASLWAGDFTKNAFISVGNFLSPLYTLIIISIAVNFVFMVILSILRVVKGIIKGQ